MSTLQKLQEQSKKRWRDPEVAKRINKKKLVKGFKKTFKEILVIVNADEYIFEGRKKRREKIIRDGKPGDLIPPLKKEVKRPPAVYSNSKAIDKYL